MLTVGQRADESPNGGANTYKYQFTGEIFSLMLVSNKLVLGFPGPAAPGTLVTTLAKGQSTLPRLYRPTPTPTPLCVPKSEHDSAAGGPAVRHEPARRLPCPRPFCARVEGAASAPRCVALGACARGCSSALFPHGAARPQELWHKLFCSFGWAGSPWSACVAVASWTGRFTDTRVHAARACLHPGPCNSPEHRWHFGPRPQPPCKKTGVRQ